MNLPASEIDAEVRAWLEKIAIFLNLDRIALVQFSGDGNAFLATHSYGYLSDSEIVGLDLDVALPWYAGKLRNDEVVVINDVDEDVPETAQEERQFAIDQQIGSHLALPLKAGSGIVGGLAFSSLVKRNWPDRMIRQSKLLAEILGNALHRKIAQCQIEELLQFEQMVSEISGIFVNIQADEVDDTINYGLRCVSKFLKADRCSLYQYSNQQKSYRISHTWVKKGALPAPISNNLASR